MRYEVRCGCGKPHAVAAADAGASVRCGCGAAVEVPPLHQLRAAAGQAALSPAVRIQTLLLEGRLPGTRECAGCFRETDGLCRVSVQCRLATDHVEAGAPVAGCLLMPFVGVLLGAVVMLKGGSQTTRQAGHDIAFSIPLPVCDACRPGLAEGGDLRVALRTVPDYAALLDHYPKARVAVS